MDFHQYVLDHKDEILAATKELLAIPSVLDHFDETSETPFGTGITEALHAMLKRAKQDGFITKNIDNFAAHIEYGSGKDIFGILCHLDVVPPGDGWSHPPFDPIIHDGKIFARGASDDKGPTMAAYFALKFLKDLDFEPSQRIRIILGTDEETAWRGIEKYFETEQMPDLGFAPDAMFPLIYGEKGILSFDITGPAAKSPLVRFQAGDRYNVVPDHAEARLSIDLSKEFDQYLAFHELKGERVGDRYIVHGKRAHAMQPNLGINAAFILAEFLHQHIEDPFLAFINEYLTFDHLGEKLRIDHVDPEMHEFTMNPAIFDYDKDQFRIGINCRYPKGWDLDNAKWNLKAALSKYHFKYDISTNMPVHYVDKNDPLVQSLHAAYVKYTGDADSELLTIGGGTYARSLKKAVAFGPTMPGRRDVAHQIDEFLHVDDLLVATAIYMEAIYQITK